MAEASVLLRGIALHRGEAAEVRLTRAPGPITWVKRGAEAKQAELRAARTDRGVTIASGDGRVVVDLAEHLLAALGGLGVSQGVRVETDSDELPLLDGGARLFCEALFAIGAPCGEARSLRVAKEATIRHGSSVYRFTPPAGEPLTPAPAPTLSVAGSGARPRVTVDVSFRAPVGREVAEWGGDPAEFFANIAPARTFGWADEHEALLAAARARGVDLKSVIVFTDAGVIPGCRPNKPGEIARHKLLDLVGDLALYGGPPQGAVDAIAPGHAATHAVFAEALAAGVIVREIPT